MTRNNLFSRETLMAPITRCIGFLFIRIQGEKGKEIQCLIKRESVSERSLCAL